MRAPHKYAKEITHWLNGGAIEYKDKNDLCWHDYNPSNINRAFPSGALYFIDGTEYRVKPEPEIPKTRITESDYNFYKERIQSKLHPDHTTFFMMQKVMIEIAQESLRLAVENGDLIIPTK